MSSYVPEWDIRKLFKKYLESADVYSSATVKIIIREKIKSDRLLVERDMYFIDKFIDELISAHWPRDEGQI